MRFYLFRSADITAEVHALKADLADCVIRLFKRLVESGSGSCDAEQKGSSVTHGLAASRPGMTYGARFGRDNGFYCFNLGFSGKSKLQPEYARYLADVEADASKGEGETDAK